jgi:hypothetical protein
MIFLVMLIALFAGAAALDNWANGNATVVVVFIVAWIGLMAAVQEYLDSLQRLERIDYRRHRRLQRKRRRSQL